MRKNKTHLSSLLRVLQDWYRDAFIEKYSNSIILEVVKAVKKYVAMKNALIRRNEGICEMHALESLQNGRFSMFLSCAFEYVE